mgnify:CR=1 FL=1
MATLDMNAIFKAYPNAVTCDDTEGVKDDEGNSLTIDQSKVDAARVELNKLNYIKKRVDSYPDIGDQLDDLFRKGAFSTDMTAKLQAVKDAHPKSS